MTRKMTFFPLVAALIGFSGTAMAGESACITSDSTRTLPFKVGRTNADAVGDHCGSGRLHECYLSATAARASLQQRFWHWGWCYRASASVVSMVNNEFAIRNGGKPDQDTVGRAGNP